MKARILSTCLLWALLIGIPYFLGHIGSLILMLLFAGGTLFEASGMLRKIQPATSQSTAWIAHAFLLLGMAVFPPWQIPPVGWVSIAFGVVLIISLFRSPVEAFIPAVSSQTLLLAIIGIPFSIGILFIHEMGLLIPIWILAVAKFTDVGALLTGLWIGKRPMSPKLSPKKTWEGLGGGILLAILVSLGFNILFQSHLPEFLTPLHATWMAIPIALAGVVSDLMESAFKRAAKVKDSGSLIPGIGGCFDLTDSLILAMPVGYFLIWCLR